MSAQYMYTSESFVYKQCIVFHYEVPTSLNTIPVKSIKIHPFFNNSEKIKT